MGNIIVQEKLRGYAGRLLDSLGLTQDGNEVAHRMGRYGEGIVEPLFNKNQACAGEGSFFVNCSPTVGTGVKLQGDTTTAFVATTPSILIVNQNAAGGKSIYLDYVRLLMTAAGAGLATLNCNILVDTVSRYSTGGTDVSANSKNTNAGSSIASGAKIYYGATALAATASRQVGRAVLRGAIPVVNDQYVLNFGNGGGTNAGVTDGTTTVMQKEFNFAPIVLAPGTSCLIHLWAASMSTSPSCEYEIGYIER